MTHTVYLECGPLSGAYVFSGAEPPTVLDVMIGDYEFTFARHPIRRQFLALGYAPVYVCVAIHETVIA